MTRWSDVSSAPKDELVLVASENEQAGKWMIKVGYFLSETEEWTVLGADWSPSHWAELPEPPVRLQ